MEDKSLVTRCPLQSVRPCPSVLQGVNLLGGLCGHSQAGSQACPWRRIPCHQLLQRHVCLSPAEGGEENRSKGGSRAPHPLSRSEDCHCVLSAVHCTWWGGGVLLQDLAFNMQDPPYMKPLMSLLLPPGSFLGLGWAKMDFRPVGCSLTVCK